MILGFKALFTIIKERLILKKSWKEVKEKIDRDARKNPLVKVIKPIVRRVVQDVQATPGQARL